MNLGPYELFVLNNVKDALKAWGSGELDDMAAQWAVMQQIDLVCDSIMAQQIDEEDVQDFFDLSLMKDFAVAYVRRLKELVDSETAPHINNHRSSDGKGE